MCTEVDGKEVLVADCEQCPHMEYVDGWPTCRYPGKDRRVNIHVVYPSGDPECPLEPIGQPFEDIVHDLAKGIAYRRWDHQRRCWRVLYLHLGCWIYGGWEGGGSAGCLDASQEHCLLKTDLAATDWMPYPDTEDGDDQD